MDVGDGAFAWVRVRGDFDAVAVAGPVGALGLSLVEILDGDREEGVMMYHDDHAFDALC